MSDPFQSLDLSLFRSINAFVGMCPTFDSAVRIAADSYLLRCAPLIGALWWLWFRSDDNARRHILAGVAASIAASICSRMLQMGIDLHPRPFHVAALYDFTLPAGIKTDWGRGGSFPSDTAALHFALATTIWTVWRRGGAVALAWAFVVVALPRVYLTYHWPSDIIGGALLGISIVLLFNRLPVVLAGASLTVRTSLAHPSLFYPFAYLVTYQLTTAFEDSTRLMRVFFKGI